MLNYLKYIQTGYSCINTVLIVTAIVVHLWLELMISVYESSYGTEKHCSIQFEYGPQMHCYRWQY